MTTRSASHELRRPIWQGTERLIAGVAVIAATAGVLALYALQGAAAALAMAALLTCGMAVIAAPRAGRLAAYVGVAALPFISAWPLLRPDEYSYATYFAALALLLVGLGAFQPRMFTFSFGTAFLTYVSIAATVTLVVSEGIRSLPRFSYIVMAFAMYTLVRRGGRDERRILIALLSAMAAVQSALAVSQTLAGRPVFTVALPELLQSERNYFAWVLPGVSRLVIQGSGTFAHFNALGAVLSIFVPLSFGLWMMRKRSLWRLGVLLLTVAGLISTFSRGALLGALGGALFVLWFGPTRSRRAVLTLLACLAVLAGLLGLSVASQYYESTQNLTVRAQTWRTAFDDALNRPSSLVLGYGYGHFGGEVLSAGLGGASVTQRSGIMASLHSGHLQLLLEFGLLGVALFAAWLAAGFGRLRAATPPIIVASLGGVLGVLISQTLDSTLFSYAGVVLAVLLAISEGEFENLDALEAVSRNPAIKGVG